ncbi:MAG: hypothetical protein P9M01_04155 [Candidatus Kappaea frigidicola]|nr:hypothetical protein [Candidatus Kappaea frigidicola]
MRPITKFLILLIFSTVLSLYYVSQQNALLSLSYEIGHDQSMINRLLDQNNILVYNTYKLKSPNSLEEALVAENILLSSPEKDQIIYLADTSVPQSEKSSNVPRLLNILSFTQRAEADLLKDLKSKQ